MSLNTDAELVGKVLDLQGNHVFRCRAIVPPMEGPWLLGNNPLPIFTEDGRKVGFGLTHLHSQGIVTEIFLSFDTPERLDLELEKPLYLAPGQTFAYYSGSGHCQPADFMGYGISDFKLSSKPTRGGLIETGISLDDQ